MLDFIKETDLYDLDDPLDDAIKINSVEKHEPGKTPQDRTKDWDERTGKPVLDKHQRGNNEDSREMDDISIGKRREFLTTLALKDGMEEVEQSRLDEDLGDGSQLFVEEQHDEMETHDDGDWKSWEEEINRAANQIYDNNEPMSHEKEQRALRESRREKYFGRKNH